jgi:hypothetical protein
MVKEMEEQLAPATDKMSIVVLAQDKEGIMETLPGELALDKEGTKESAPEEVALEELALGKEMAESAPEEVALATVESTIGKEAMGVQLQLLEGSLQSTRHPCNPFLRATHNHNLCSHPLG